MAIAVDNARETGRYWSVPIVRAVVALIAGVVVTFSADHSPTLGLAVFAGFAIASGIVAVVLNPRRLPASLPRTLLVASGVVGVVAGLVSLAGALLGGGLAFFVYLVCVWAAITGFLELYAGLRARTVASLAGAARDWLVIGVGTAVLALVFLLLPPHPVVSVGLLGAYAVMLGVFLGIAGFSLKWAASDDVRTSTRSHEGGTR